MSSKKMWACLLALDTIVSLVLGIVGTMTGWLWAWVCCLGFWGLGWFSLWKYGTSE